MLPRRSLAPSSDHCWKPLLPTVHSIVSLCNAVLEHVPKIDRVMSELARVLKIGGYLICAVPFLQVPASFAAHAMLASGSRLPRVCIVTGQIVGPFKNGGLETSMTGLAELLAAHGAGNSVFIVRPRGRPRLEEPTNDALPPKRGKLGWEYTSYCFFYWQPCGGAHPSWSRGRAYVNLWRSVTETRFVSERLLSNSTLIGQLIRQQTLRRWKCLGGRKIDNIACLLTSCIPQSSICSRRPALCGVFARSHPCETSTCC